MATVPIHHNYIDGRWVPSATGKTFENRNPADTDDLIGFFQDSGPGNGHREAGVAALDVFSEWKSIYIDFSGKLQRAQIDVEQI